MKNNKKAVNICFSVFLLLVIFSFPAFAAETAAKKDIFGVAHDIIIKVYNSIAGISTVLAGLMSAVAVISLNFSSSQQKSDQAYAWLKRIWIAWAVINGIGAFIAYVTPMLQGYNSLEGIGAVSSGTK